MPSTLPVSPSWREAPPLQVLNLGPQISEGLSHIRLEGAQVRSPSSHSGAGGAEARAGIAACRRPWHRAIPWALCPWAPGTSSPRPPPPKTVLLPNSVRSRAATTFLCFPTGQENRTLFSIKYNTPSSHLPTPQFPFSLLQHLGQQTLGLAPPNTFSRLDSPVEEWRIISQLIGSKATERRKI